MKKLAILSLLLALVLVACGERRAPVPAQPTAATTAPSGTIVGDAATGAQLWRAKQCSACHGPNATGGMGGALADSTLPFDQFLSRTRTAQLPMPSLASADLSDGDAYSIYLWLHTLSPATTKGTAATPAPLPTGQLLGIQVWTQKGCSECHGAFAQGSARAPMLAGESYPFERERAVMRASADQNSKHAPANIPDDLLQRLLDWLRRGADPTSGC